MLPHVSRSTPREIRNVITKNEGGTCLQKPVYDCHSFGIDVVLLHPNDYCCNHGCSSTFSGSLYGANTSSWVGCAAMRQLVGWPREELMLAVTCQVP